MDVGVFIVFTLRRKGDEMDKADLTQYDLSGAQLTRFEIKPKDTFHPLDARARDRRTEINL